MREIGEKQTEVVKENIFFSKSGEYA